MNDGKEKKGIAADAVQTAEAKRSRKRWPMVIGAVVVILIAAGAGLWVWHEQPSFCNAVCHEPMDSYVQGYYENPDQLSYTHQVANTTCLECHEPKINEQIQEAQVWLAGDFSIDEEGYLTTVGVRGDASMCATADCHDIEQVIAATEDWGGVAGVNPHDSHQGYALDCSSCHTIHGQSIMYCNTCHDFEVPDGWLAPVSSEPAVA